MKRSMIDVYKRQVIGGIVQVVVQKVQHKVARVIGDTGYVLKDLFQPFVKEPLIRVLLHLDKVGHVQHFVNTRKAHSDVFTEMGRFNIHHRLYHSIRLFTGRS